MAEGRSSCWVIDASVSCSCKAKSCPTGMSMGPGGTQRGGKAESAGNGGSGGKSAHRLAIGGEAGVGTDRESISAWSLAAGAESCTLPTAPACTNASTTPTWHCCTASERMLTHESGRRLGSAPPARSRRTMCACPRLVAAESALSPRTSCAFTSAPAARRTVTDSSRPDVAAAMSAVCPSASRRLGSAPEVNRARNIATRLREAANIRLVDHGCDSILSSPRASPERIRRSTSSTFPSAAASVMRRADEKVRRPARRAYIRRIST